MISFPKQTPWCSKQDYGTPNIFIVAVEKRFGQLAIDLAASAENTKAEKFITEEQNSLAQDWGKFSGNLWLNPPFKRLEPWAKKAATTIYKPETRLYLLTPASIGANWFEDWVWGHAQVEALNPRLSFDGKAPYPKDCMLSIFGNDIQPSFSIWKWQKEL